MTAPPSGSPDELEGVKVAGGTVGYAVGTGSQAVLKASNGGMSWVFRATRRGTRMHAVDSVSTSTGYAVGLRVSSGAPPVIKTTNGAASWKRVK